MAICKPGSDPTLNSFLAKRLLLSGLLLLTFVSGCQERQQSDTEAFVDWVADHTIAAKDSDFSLPPTELKAFQTAIGTARLVGLGESRHDTREQLLLKGQLVRHLISDLGFRALILEESYPHAESLDRYVTSGEGDVPEIMNGLAGWYLWDSEEMSELVQWIREFNAEREPEQSVRIFGVDITAPAPGVQSVLDSLENSGVDVPLNDQALGLDLQQGDFWPVTWERYAALSDAQRRELAKNYEKLVNMLKANRTKLIAASSEQAFQKTQLMAEIGRRGNEFFSSGDRAEAGAFRERGMAWATLWILDQEIPNQKVILWAHNLHVAKSSFRMPGFVEDELTPMGVYLSKELGDAYVVIGGTFGTGSYPADLPPGERVFEPAAEDVMDGALARVGVPNFLVDLRKVEPISQSAKWLQQDREWFAQDANAVMVPNAAFDLVYFVNNISRSQPTPLALRRFQSMGEQR